MSSTDALTDVLKSIHLSGSTLFCTGFNTPWGMSLLAEDRGAFHVVLEGSCWLIQKGVAEPLELLAGDIVAFPTGGEHWISNTPTDGTQVRRGSEVVSQILAGDNPFWQHSSDESQQDESESLITLLCGTFHYDSSVDHPFVKDLPCFIHIKEKETPELAWLRSLVRVMANESNNPTPGSSAMLDKLTEALFIQLMREHMASVQNESSYLSALADNQIGTALNRIHSEQGAQWTVEKLAEQSAMSRTAFTDKFTKMVGVPPKVYLTDTRMQRAKKSLMTNTEPMIKIAQASGYSSEASFSKAFKQFFKLSPGKLRKNVKSE
jgi:AraC-like DNA-binding protein